jgi:hypothetical protein
MIMRFTFEPHFTRARLRAQLELVEGMLRLPAEIYPDTPDGDSQIALRACYIALRDIHQRYPEDAYEVKL